MSTASADALRLIALEHFARHGFEGASLQHIAAEAGLSKSSVLYHFDSKEALFDAAVRPALEALRVLLERLGGLPADADRGAFVPDFVDFLFEHRLAVATIVNHGTSMTGTAVIDEADRLVRDLAQRIDPRAGSALDAMRFGVGLAGATFVLVAAERWAVERLPEDEARRLLTVVLADLLLPASRRTGEPQPA